MNLFGAAGIDPGVSRLRGEIAIPQHHERVDKRTECEPSQFGISREQSSRDKASSIVF